MLSNETRRKMSESRKAFQERVGHIHRGPSYNGKWYKGRWIPEHPNASINGNIDEHRLMASKAITKPLPKGVIVHHVNGGLNGGKLVVCQDQAYHLLLHVRERAYRATGDPHKRKCPFCKQWDNPSNMREIIKSQRQATYEHKSCRHQYYLKRVHRNA